MVDGHCESVLRHRSQWLTLVAAEPDEVERDVEATGGVHHLVEMFFDRRTIQGVETRGGCARACTVELVGHRLHALGRAPREEQLSTFACKGSRDRAAHGPGGAIDDRALA